MKYIELLNRIAEKKNIPTYVDLWGNRYELAVNSRMKTVIDYYYEGQALSEFVCTHSMEYQPGFTFEASGEEVNPWK